ncbi:unnamed protein product [Cuscuta europaea]|uniref:DUF4283 domain-containing protein n=1 Tax=Cuscuta europaea TaxID=41803 RepID=A0A9P0YU16_CUSEU|nr:unnamed protein product [Cuscuta europaea]
MPPAEGVESATANRAPSYAAAVRNVLSGHRLHSQPQLFSDVDFKELPAKTPDRFRGSPAISFTGNDIQVLSSNFRFALVGTFLQKRPPISVISKAMEALGFVQPYSVGLIHSHWILVNFRSDFDFQRFWLKNTWDFFESTMTVTRWTPFYSDDSDCTLCPIWVALEGLPIHLHDVRICSQLLVYWANL